ncbi:MAG: F0F1 ATP synthase subunit A [Alphaproteobacteria bacterium]|nr:F0F1 ATP synthase subunit A [Alphaproteobacteria bacterium]
MESPLEQFEIKKIIPWQWEGIDLSFTNSALCMLITVSVIFITFTLCLHKRQIVPTMGQAFSESIYDFIQSMIGETLGKDGLKYVSLIFTLFTFIALGNMLGLFPYSFTFTSHIAAVGTLSVFFLVLNIIFGIKRRGLGYFHTFFPHGLPWIMAPLIIPVETLSLLAKPFSLTIRLAVNMSVGHIMLKVLGSFIVTMGIFGFIPLIADMCIIMFELFVTLLQAYIYTTLSCVYLSQAISDEE